MTSTAPAQENIKTREEYLMTAVEKLRPWFTERKLEIPDVRVSCGFPSKSPLKNLGECWSATCSADGSRHIFVTPLHKHVQDAIGTLAHELVHACLDDSAKHGPEFKKAMKMVGLEGTPKSAGPGPELQLFIENLCEELGEYPNSPLKPKEKKQSDKAATKKSFKLFCPKKRNNDKSCSLTELTHGGDYTVTSTRKMLVLGFPLCPGCSREMEMEPEDFELYRLVAE